MDTPLDYIREAADSALYSPNAINARLFEVHLVTTVWDGDRPGLGNKTVTSVPVYNTLVFTGQQVYVRCRQVTVQDVVLSQGLLKDIQWIVGPIVLPYATDAVSGGYDINLFQQDNKNQQSHILLKGPGLPSQGQVCKKASDETDHITVFKLFCKNTGSQGA
jgi:hypothetical protein